MVMCEMYPATWQEFIEEKYFRDHKEIYTNGSEIMLVSDVKKMMQHYSQERPKGRWIETGKGYNWHYFCSECGWVDGFPMKDRHNFCPNCGKPMETGGADMREKQEPKEEWKKGRYFDGDEHVCPNWVDIRESE